MEVPARLAALVDTSIHCKYHGQWRTFFVQHAEMTGFGVSLTVSDLFGELLAVERILYVDLTEVSSEAPRTYLGPAERVGMICGLNLDSVLRRRMPPAREWEGLGPNTYYI